MSGFDAHSLLNSPPSLPSPRVAALENAFLSSPPSPLTPTFSEPALGTTTRQQPKTHQAPSNYSSHPQSARPIRHDPPQLSLYFNPAPPDLPPDTQTCETYIASLRAALTHPSKLLLTKDSISNTALNQINWHGEHLKFFISYRDRYRQAIAENKRIVQDAESKLVAVKREVMEGWHAIRVAARDQKSLQDQRTSSSSTNEHQDTIAINAARLAIAGEAYADARTRELSLERQEKRSKEAWRRQWELLKTVQAAIKDIRAERGELKDLAIEWVRGFAAEAGEERKRKENQTEVGAGMRDKDVEKGKEEDWVVNEDARRGARAVITWFATRYATCWETDGRAKQETSEDQEA